MGRGVWLFCEIEVCTDMTKYFYPFRSVARTKSADLNGRTATLLLSSKGKIELKTTNANETRLNTLADQSSILRAKVKSCEAKGKQ